MTPPGARPAPRPPAAAPDAAAPCELCAFRVADEEYAIDLRRVREILPAPAVTRVPHAPPGVEGVIELRGEVVPVVDVRRRLGLPAADAGRRKVMVVHVAGRVVALLVDAVIEVVRLPRSALGPPPPLLAPGGARLFLGVCGAREARPGARVATAPGGRLRLLLNVKALLATDAPGLAAEARRRSAP